MKKILDACCGSRMFWFDKKNPNVLFCDVRSEQHRLCDGRILEIKPDMEVDFREMPFKDGEFKKSSPPYPTGQQAKGATQLRTLAGRSLAAPG